MTDDLKHATTSVNDLNREVAERTKAEAALRESEERFRQVAENAGEWIWEVDADGRYTYSNPTIEKILGYRVDEVVGKKHFYDFFAPSVKEQFKKAAFEAFARKAPFTGFVNTNICKDGRTVIFETNGSPVIDGSGRLRGYRGADRDVTERKASEERQEQLVAQLEKTNQELKDFAHIVSHDLKAPLRGIRTLAEWIVQDCSDKLGEDSKQQMGLLINRVERMHNLIDGILRYSRIGATEEEKTVLSLGELVPEIIDMIAPPKHIAVVIDGPLPTLHAEATRVTQVFQNLVSNAVKYMDKPQGRIRIGCVEEDGFWRFSVSDNGPGIEEKHFDKIFRMFQTLSARDDYESTGVGLAIVKKIIEMYGGRIWVESQPGEGSTFLFTWPKSHEDVAHEKPEARTAC
jgi:two-component system sensor kinase FixL